MWCRVTELDIAHPSPEKDGKISFMTLWPSIHPLVACSLHTINTSHFFLWCSTLIKFPTSSLSVYNHRHTEIYFGGREKKMLRASGSSRTAAPDWWGGTQGSLPNSAPSHEQAHSTNVWHISTKQQGLTMLWIRQLKTLQLREEGCRCWEHKPYFPGVRADASRPTSCFTAAN